MPVPTYGTNVAPIDYGLINARNQSAAIIRGINAGNFGANVLDESVFREAAGNPTITRTDLTQAQTINNAIGKAFSQEGQQAANVVYNSLFPDSTRVKVANPAPTTNIIPAPVVVTPPAQVGNIISSPTIPNPIIETSPVQSRIDTTTSSPSIFTQAKPILLIGIAVFAAVTLFLPPKGSKRK